MAGFVGPKGGLHTAEMACGCKRKFTRAEEKQWREGRVGMPTIECQEHGPQKVQVVSGDMLQF
jgi:hypothetical protein